MSDKKKEKEEIKIVPPPVEISEVAQQQIDNTGPRAM